MNENNNLTITTMTRIGIMTINVRKQARKMSIRQNIGTKKTINGIMIGSTKENEQK